MKEIILLKIKKIFRILFVEFRVPWRFKHLIQPFVSITHLYLANGYYLSLKTISIRKILPNFIIIGAQKAGTTSLYKYLSQHPDIFMSDIKEPGLFLDCNEFEKYTDLRLSQNKLMKVMLYGYSGQSVIGEASTYYTKAPIEGSEVPENVKSKCPDMKFIYMLRNPFARIVSQYLHYIERERFKGSFDNFLENEPTYLYRSMYYYQLKNYLKYFEKEQFKIIIFEEFIRNTPTVLKSVSEFLEIASITYNVIPPQNKSRNILNCLEEDLKFNEEVYDKIIIAIKNDLNKMEKFLNRILGIWDISKKTWCRNV